MLAAAKINKDWGTRLVFVTFQRFFAVKPSLISVGADEKLLTAVIVQVNYKAQYGAFEKGFGERRGAHGSQLKLSRSFCRPQIGGEARLKLTPVCVQDRSSITFCS